MSAASDSDSLSPKPEDGMADLEFLIFFFFLFEIDRFYLGASNRNQERSFEMSKESCKRQNGSRLRRRGGRRAAIKVK